MLDFLSQVIVPPFGTHVNFQINPPESQPLFINLKWYDFSQRWLLQFTTHDHIPLLLPIPIVLNIDLLEKYSRGDIIPKNMFLVCCLKRDFEFLKNLTIDSFSEKQAVFLAFYP